MLVAIGGKSMPPIYQGLIQSSSLFLLAGTILLGAQDTGQQSTPPAPAQTQVPAAQAQQLPTAPALKVTTRLVVVDAVVTDHSGKAVTGLKPSDFEILENGHAQVIRAFGSRDPVPQGKESAAQKLVLPPGVFTNIPQFNPDDGPPTILLIDALNTQLRDQAYLRQQLVKYLQSVGPRRNVAIFTLGSRLRLVQDFTTDPALLQQAVKRIANHTSLLNPDPGTQPDTQLALDSSDPALADMAQSLKDFQAEQDSFLMDVRVGVTVEALKMLAHHVAGFPGRKNLVWLSGAFPFYIAPDTDLRDPFVSQRQYADQVRDAATSLTDAQVAVYPVDSRGLVGSLMPDASVRVPNSRNPGAAMASTMSKASADLQNSHDVMSEIAKETGGRAFYNRNDIDHAIALSVEDGSAYYTLGYYPEDKRWDGKFRKIEVRVVQKGLQVRNRRGYFATAAAGTTGSDDKKAERDFIGSLSLEAPTATAVAFAAQPVPPTKEEPAVVINFGVDPRSILFQVPEDGLHHAKVDFVTLAFDAKGKIVASQKQTLTTALKPETYARIMAGRLLFPEKINLAPGKYTLKMGVWDRQTNLIGTATGSIEVPPQN
jgi:VWFA-related protein